MSNLETHLREQDELTAEYEQRELEARQANATAPRFMVGYEYAPGSAIVTLRMSREAARHLADASERMGYHDGDEALAAHVTSVLREAIDQTRTPPAFDLDPDEHEGPDLRPFNVSLGVSVRAYGNATVMASSMAEAVEIVRRHALRDAMIETIDDIEDNVWDQVSNCEWSTSSDYAILSVEDEEGDEETIDDIDLCPDGPETIIDAAHLRALVVGTPPDELPQWPDDVIEEAPSAEPSIVNRLVAIPPQTVFAIPTHGGGDPDGENAARVNRGLNLMFSDAELSASEQLTDILVNLMHGAASLRLDFASNLRLACSHFAAETAKEPKV